MKNLFLYFIFSVLLVFVVISCTEEYPLHTEYYEDAIVIESHLTDELAYQKVKLSHVSQLEKDEFEIENDADVWIEDNQGVSFHFIDNTNGEYVSEIMFKAVSGRTYTLNIETSDGELYKSRGETLPEPVSINQLYFQPESHEETSGVQIYTHIENTSDTRKYLRYEFKETFKIVTPETVTQDIQLENVAITDSNLGYLTYDVILTPTLIEKNICYTTQHQQEILLNLLNTNSSITLPIRYIESNDSMLRERYSIELVQYSQTEDSYNYYNTLKELGVNNNVFVENQPGAVKGNITSVSNKDKNAIGFFDVVSISKKRIYFNWYDIGLIKPHYKYYRETKTLNYNDNTWFDRTPNQRMIMYELLHEDPPWEFIMMPINPYDLPLYTLARPRCANCTIFSSNIKPEFWED